MGAGTSGRVVSVPRPAEEKVHRGQHGEDEGLQGLDEDLQAEDRHAEDPATRHRRCC